MSIASYLGLNAGSPAPDSRFLLFVRSHLSLRLLYPIAAKRRMRTEGFVNREQYGAALPQ